MKYNKGLVSIILWIIFAGFSSFGVNLNKIIEKHPNITFAIQVLDLKTGKIVYSYAPDRLLIPASVTKIFTAYAALDYLGDDFTYQTTVSFNDNALKNGVLEDDLYIKFSGDPSLTKEQFVNLLSMLHKKYNIKEIKSKIVIDDTLFDQDYKAIGETWDDGKFCYAAPSSSIVINRNCFLLALFPGKHEGASAKIVGKSYAQLSNEILTQNNSKCSPELTEFPNNFYSVNGCLDLGTKNIPLKIAYQDPRLMIVNLIKDVFNNLHIIKHHDIIFKKHDKRKSTTLSHKSVPLRLLVKEMQSQSDNLMASNILKTLGAYFFKEAGNFKNGSLALKKILQSKTRINVDNMRLVDGAGQSRYNLLSPNHIVQLLQSAYSNKNIWNSFYNSLSIMGVDGLLSIRLKDHTRLHGKIRAKSGTLTGVANLAGYINNKEERAFAIMFNGYVGSKVSMSKLIDEILVEIDKL